MKAQFSKVFQVNAKKEEKGVSQLWLFTPSSSPSRTRLIYESFSYVLFSLLGGRQLEVGGRHHLFSYFTHLCLSILENVCHDQIEDGLQIIAHNPNVKDLSDRIQNIKQNFGKNFRYKVYLGPDRKCESYSTESKFEAQCKLYFENYY